ncbi:MULTISPECIES: cell division protein FtsZ [Nitrosomonas]|uniref:Cell division protein FtsZ n=1 Tax=Nitrosomonas communis TaxID=44574 RepID=A0A0F7KER6_9PROT|nr:MULTISPECIES: cell division protein FtsZ [Nitrosomonas]AKH37663.1 cell division protein FtsZ [Nitrosomonas communis]TYP83859.1 cell division protein FtsZ [Nitrosomonas communis]UVS62967.1 cell division protein FtsZ [Nitrosomonas sp. PLL12]SDW44020.1 cell division protein FtsZ [Nitrosomonas communis]SFI56915.1 cell division protein FtsZ [Nitrosomonas sp. Nm34]
MFEIMNTDSQEAIIKVIGVGGCGGNAVDHMIQNETKGVEFICINTDAQALKANRAPTLLQLGGGITRGLGAGANPEVGREAALEDRDRIAELIQGADMLFITAGMGGGTGTGAAPVVAQIAKEMGILTVAVVSKPFSFEGKRLKTAQAGMEALAQHVDSLIVIPNDKLMMVLGNDISMLDAFKAANDVLYGAVAGIAEVINCPGLVNVDFADVKTVMSEMGMAMMGSAVASGVDRARMAAEQAVASPLLEEITLSGARGVLVNITANSGMKMREVHEVMNTVKELTAEDATVIVGTVIDEGMNDDLRVTLVATGLGSVTQTQTRPLTVIHTRTGTDDRASTMQFEEPAVMRTGRRSSATVAAMQQSGVDPMDIPAFLRRQAD